MEKKIATEEIWIFIEKKFEAAVPAYIKNVLSVCGYNNGVSIGGIEDDDIQYMQDEVRNGNVEKVFENSKIDYLEDCTKQKEDFEFVRGHKKYLMAIVGFLKNHLAENGPASFSLKEQPTKKKVKAMKKVAKIDYIPPSQENVVKLIPLIKSALNLENHKTETLGDNEEKQKLVDLWNEENLETKTECQTTKTLSVLSNGRDSETKLHDQQADRFSQNDLEFKNYPSKLDSLKADKRENSQIDDTALKPGIYVIYSTIRKSSIRWPNAKPIAQNFVGQVLFIKGTEMEVIVLKNSIYKRCNFSYPEKYETMKISRKDILGILQDPVKNRRGELVFEDKSLLE